jgi:DNA-binding transcriptional ArsR family regulator
MNQAPDIENRKKIFQLIAAHQGLNLSSIAEHLNMSIPLVDYHTRCLIDQGVIIVMKEGGFKRYYIKGNIGIQDKLYLGILRQEIPLKIVLFLLNNPYSKHKEILDYFDIAGSTLTYHLNKLIKKGVIHYHDAKLKKGYKVVNSKEVYQFILLYKPSTFLKRFKETWADDFSIP